MLFGSVGFQVSRIRATIHNIIQKMGLTTEIHFLQKRSFVFTVVGLQSFWQNVACKMETLENYNSQLYSAGFKAL
jgi:hypothetical protein